MDTPEALRKRISMSTQKDVLLGMFLESSLVHAQKRYGQPLADGLKRDILGGKSLVSFFRYPVVDLLRMVETATQASRSEPRAFHGQVQEFAAAAVQHFFGSPVGKTMTVLAGTNVQRLLQSAPSAFKAVCSFGERRYERTGERSAELVCEGDLLGPAWEEGVVTQALQSVCNVTPKVTIELKDAAAASFVVRLSW